MDFEYQRVVVVVTVISTRVTIPHLVVFSGVLVVVSVVVPAVFAVVQVGLFQQNQHFAVEAETAATSVKTDWSQH